MSISNVEVYDTDVRKLTNTLICVFGAHLTWPIFTIRHRCAMFEVSRWDRRPKTGRYKIQLICIIIDSLEDLERTISSGSKLRLPLTRESIFSKVQPNPIFSYCYILCISEFVSTFDF